MISSKTIRMRLVEEMDAEFILSLRLSEKLNRFLSVVDSDVEAQRAWIKTYKHDEKKGSQYYFIIEKHDGTPCGTVRIYDIRSDSFCWGSWILNDNKTRFSAIESALMVYQFGFENLGFEKSHFEVVKGNEQVIKFHKKFGAEVVGEDNENYYFNITKADVKKSKEKFRGLL